MIGWGIVRWLRFVVEGVEFWMSKVVLSWGCDMWICFLVLNWVLIIDVWRSFFVVIGLFFGFSCLRYYVIG